MNKEWKDYGRKTLEKYPELKSRLDEYHEKCPRCDMLGEFYLLNNDFSVTFACGCCEVTSIDLETGKATFNQGMLAKSSWRSEVENKRYINPFKTPPNRSQP